MRRPSGSDELGVLVPHNLMDLERFYNDHPGVLAI